ncbi:glycerate kinase, partial [Saprospiraceae bacterium]|nr:glycerate kinase [Saprospiraceae bacterium]
EILKHDSSIEVIKCPLADGGDGTLAVIQNHIDLRPVYVEVQDPLRRNREAYYCVNANEAYIELPIVSGLALLDEGESNPMITSTYGTGQLIRHAIQNGCETIYLMLGGSCTNDVGIGILAALGYKFLDDESQVIDPVGQNLNLIQVTDNSDVIDLSHVKINILCDVNNPLYGPNGAAHIFGKQKGADADERDLLDNGSQHFASIIESYNGVNIQSLSGGGAAGGIAAGLYGLCNATILPGFKTIADLVNLEKLVIESDIIISGEGRLDDSSFDGKVVGGVYEICKRHKKLLHLIVGQNTCSENVLCDKEISITTVSSYAENNADAQAHVVNYLREIGKDFIKNLKGE